MNHYERHDAAVLKLHCLRPAAARLLRGKAIYSDGENEFIFVENPPRILRSIEVGRGAHCRYVRRPDGAYTLTFHFRVGEKYLREVLISEVRNAVNEIFNYDAKNKTQKR